MTRLCWCQRPAKGACGCHCANHDVAPPAFEVFGVNVPASVARGADDGVTVFEPDQSPVTRWRTETATSIRRRIDQDVYDPSPYGIDRSAS